MFKILEDMWLMYKTQGFHNDHNVWTTTRPIELGVFFSRQDAIDAAKELVKTGKMPMYDGRAFTYPVFPCEYTFVETEKDVAIECDYDGVKYGIVIKKISSFIKCTE